VRGLKLEGGKSPYPLLLREGGKSSDEQGGRKDELGRTPVTKEGREAKMVPLGDDFNP